MTRITLRITLIITALVIYMAVTAQPRAMHIGPSEYRAANKNWAAAQDDRGFTYFGNDMGLLEFDGMQWKLHKLPRASVVRSVAALNHNTLFTGSFEEFGRWDRDASGRLYYTSLVPDDPSQRPHNSDFWKIYITPRGVLFQSFNELYVYDFHTVRKIDSHMNILFLLPSAGHMWAQQMEGPLYRFEDDQFSPVEGSSIFANTTVRLLLDLPDSSSLLAGTGSNGLWHYDGHRFTEWNPALSVLMQRYELNCGIRTSRNTYLLGTILNGIYEVDAQGKVLHHFSTDNILKNNSVMSLFEDDSHNIWVMTDRGLTYLNYGDQTEYYLSDKWVHGSLYDAVKWQGQLLIGTNQGVFCIPEKQLNRSDFTSGFKYLPGTQGQVWSLKILDGRLWCCHNTGIMEIGRDLSVRRAFAMGGYRMNRITTNGHPHTLYASYYQLRLLDLATGTATSLSEIPESFYDAQVDHMGNIWLEHPTKGVYRCRLSDDALHAEDIHYYGGDSGDELPYKMQIFRVGGRISLVGDDRFYIYNDIRDRIESDSMLNACFAGIRGLRRIIQTGASRYWVITSAGAYHLTHDGYTATLTPDRDIPANSMVYGYENVAQLDDSTTLFCCDNGFIIRRGFGCNKTHHPTAPWIESIWAGEKEHTQSYFSADAPAQIPYNKNSVSFRFAAPHAFADGLSFRYRLKGVDAAWIDQNTTGEAPYARLPKGKYTFEVAAEDRFGNLSMPTFTDIEILPPWYTSGWAYAGYTLLIITILYSTWLIVMHRYRSNYLRKLRHREIISLRSNNKELQQELEIRDAELFSQSSLLIAKNELIVKIRDMIDDFHRKQGNKSLSPLFYRINTFIESNLDTENDWRLFLIKFEQKHSGFFQILKEYYPDLTSNDLRLCACLKLNLDTKDIAALMNLSVRAVENSRYRLRKKLKLQPTQNLNEFLMSIESDPENTPISESTTIDS